MLIELAKCQFQVTLWLRFLREQTAEDAAYSLHRIDIYGCRHSFDESSKINVVEIYNT